MVEYHK